MGAVDAENTWQADKKAWCCRVHHRGCPPTAAPIEPILPPVVQPIMPIMPAAPADPYNCADGFANWQAGWSVGKKQWCCRVHGKGPRNRWWLRDHIATLRLRCWICKLD